jgi:hypothetical protein
VTSGPEHLPDVLRQGIPHRIGQVDRRRAGLDHGRGDITEELQVAARGIFRRELHVVGELPGEPNGRRRLLEAARAIDAQLVAQVQV